MKKWLSALTMALFLLVIAFPPPIAAKPALFPTILPLGYVVNSLADTDDGSCTSTNCTLREAINAASGTGLPIMFSVSGTINLTSPFPSINNHDVSITGPAGGITINGGNAYQVFDVGMGPHLTLKKLTIAHAYFDGYGGAITTKGILTIEDVTFMNNHSSSKGGAIYFLAGQGSIERSTFIDNDAPLGGAINNGFVVLSITNSTFSGNSATDGAALLAATMSSVYIESSTFSDNTASSGSTVTATEGIVHLHNTILANTITGTNCSSIGIQDDGNNIEDGTTCNLNPAKSSHSSTDPLLGPLRNNGGFTKTMSIAPASLAVDGATLPGSCPATDQRGFPRPVDSDQNGSSVCDIGAFEIQLMVFLPLIRR